VNVVNVKGKSKTFKFRQGRRGDWRKAYVTLADGQSIDVMTTSRPEDPPMPLMTFKPTSPGRRSMVRVVTPGLHKGAPHAALVEKQGNSGGRNHHGRITTRHIGGGHKQHYRIIDFKRDKEGIPPASSASNTIRTAPRTSRCCATSTASAATSSRRRA
jgi:hypothetical protein